MPLWLVHIAGLGFGLRLQFGGFSLWLQLLCVESLHCKDPDSDTYPEWLYRESESESESESGNVNEPLQCHKQIYDLRAKLFGMVKPFR